MLRPVLLVTCRAGNEDWCVEEIGNVLFPYDHMIRVEKTRYPGLIIVYSNLDPLKAYNYALPHEYGFVKKIIPILYICSFSDEIFEKVDKLVKPGERVKVKLRIRGRRGYSRIFWRKIMEVLKSKQARHDPSSETCLYIEGVDDIIYIGKGKC